MSRVRINRNAPRLHDAPAKEPGMQSSLAPDSPSSAGDPRRVANQARDLGAEQDGGVGVVATRWVGLGLLAVFSFLLTLDDTALSVALPSIGRDLGLGLSGLELVVNAYTLALAVLLLAGARLADALGSRRVFLWGLAVFTIASLAAGVSSTGVPLIGARVLQGGGAALMLPATLAIISSTFPERQRGMAIGVWAGISGGLAIGPLLGAALTESLGWGAIFLQNVPFGVLGLAFGRRILNETTRASARRHFDLIGMLVSGASLCALVFALTEGMSYGWASPLVLSNREDLMAKIRVAVTDVTGARGWVSTWSRVLPASEMT